jgi:hypothetical protein
MERAKAAGVATIEGNATKGLKYITMQYVFPKLQKQIKSNCAQTCISMLTNKSIKEIEEIICVQEGLHTDMIRLACIHLGVPIIGHWTKEPWDTHFDSTRDFPPNCILHAKRKCENGNATHAMLCVSNEIYDPNGFKRHCSEFDDTWELLNYLEFKTECWMISGEFTMPDGSIGKQGKYATYIKLNN